MYYVNVHPESNCAWLSETNDATGEVDKIFEHEDYYTAYSYMVDFCDKAEYTISVHCERPTDRLEK